MPWDLDSYVRFCCTKYITFNIMCTLTVINVTSMSVCCEHNYSVDET